MSIYTSFKAVSSDKSLQEDFVHITSSDAPEKSASEDSIINVVLPALPQLEKENSDYKLTAGRTVVYCTIDAVGGLRQTSTAAQGASSLASHFQHVPSLGLQHPGQHLVALLPTLSRASTVANAAIPIGLLITGPLCAATGAAWTIPDSYAGLKTANEQLRTAKKNSGEEEEGKRVVEIARLGLANQSLYAGMGVAQTATGVLMMLSPNAAHVFHYAPILTGHAASVASLAAGVALGAIYTVRGGLMFARAAKSYHDVAAFQEELKKWPTVDSVIARMQDAADGKLDHDSDYIKRRVDVSCLVDEKGNRYTAQGILKPGAEKATPYGHNTAEKREYLARVDKGIYTEKFKQKVGMTIAAAMFIGGVLAIALSVMTGGLPAIIIATSSAVFFMGMEYMFLTYDSSRLFEWMRDRMYKGPEWLKELR